MINVKKAHALTLLKCCAQNSIQHFSQGIKVHYKNKFQIYFKPFHPDKVILLRAGHRGPVV